VRQRIEALTNYFMAHGIPDTATAQHQAVIAIGKLVKRESFVLAFSDTFAVIGVVLVIAAAVLLFARRGQAGGGAASAH
jgi:MFS transporter, DHA2 family, multidrug resistance protein